MVTARKPKAEQRGQPIEPKLLVKFTVPGEPVPKARPRFVPMTGHAYTPEKTARAEERIRQYCFVAAPGLRPTEGHIRLVAHFFMAGSGRGDWDNFGKLVSDALNGVVWIDDAQVTQAEIELHPFEVQSRSEVEVWLVAVPA